MKKRKKIVLGYIPKNWFKNSHYVKNYQNCNWWKRAKDLYFFRLPSITKTKLPFLDMRSKERIKIRITVEEV